MTGGVWVLLRGLMREHGHWGPFAQQLQQVLHADAVLTPDLAGNGLLHLERSPTTIDAMVDRCRQQVRATLGQQPPPVHVLSISMGGMLAAAWAHKHPEELASLCVMSSSMRPLSPLWHRLRPRQWPRVLGLLCSGATAAQWETAIWRMTSSQPIDPTALAQWIAIRQQRPVRTSNALRQLWAAARFHAPISPPPVPTLILSGQADELVHPQCSRVLATHWRSPIAIHPSAGHDLALDAPQWVLKQLEDWQDRSPATLAHASPKPETP